MPPAAIAGRGLTKTYGKEAAAVHALRGIDLEIAPGEFVVMLGPSGSGKTTLLNVVGALEPPTSGTLSVDGVDLAGLDVGAQTDYRRDTVGFVFQFFNLIPTLTAFENVALIAEITGNDPERRSREVLEAVGLADRSMAYPAQMSGGEQQRVAIARGLVKDPPLLLCDEPTGSLDLDTGRQVLDLLRTVSETRRTVLLVTHNSAIARIAGRVLHMRDGLIVADERNDHPVPASDLQW